jgi:hypothetical protein
MGADWFWLMNFLYNHMRKHVHQLRQNGRLRFPENPGFRPLFFWRFK